MFVSGDLFRMLGQGHFTKSFTSAAIFVLCSFVIDRATVTMELPTHRGGQGAPMDVAGLASELDKIEEVRSLLREKQQLFERADVKQTWCEPSRANCVANMDALKVILKRLAATPGWKLPYLDPLKAEIAELFRKVGHSPTEKAIYTTSIEVKKLAGFVKRRASPARKEFTKDWGCMFACVFARGQSGGCSSFRLFESKKTLFPHRLSTI